MAGSATVGVSRSSGRGKTIAPASGANPHIHGNSGMCVCVFVRVSTHACVTSALYV